MEKDMTNRSIAEDLNKPYAPVPEDIRERVLAAVA